MLKLWTGVTPRRAGWAASDFERYDNFPRLSLLQPQPAGERLRAHPLELLPQRVARVGETVLDAHRYGQASPVGDFTYHCVASSRTATPPAAPRKPTQ